MASLGITERNLTNFVLIRGKDDIEIASEESNEEINNRPRSWSGRKFQKFYW